jgi:hypothetical protein
MCEINDDNDHNKCIDIDLVSLPKRTVFVAHNSSDKITLPQ